MNLYKLAQNEIIRFHEMIQSWFRGEALDVSKELLFDRFDENFSMITPTANKISLTMLKNEWADSVKGEYPDHVELIDNFKEVIENEDTIVLTYEETQVRGSQVSSRISTAVMIRDHDNPNLVNWLALHESSKL